MDKFNRSIKSPVKIIDNSADFIERPYLPDCWNDDKRMDVLFHPFRIREINPEGWDLKMNFWINLINKWCLFDRKVVFTIDEIRQNFNRDERLPHLDCIKLVVSHMKRQNKILFKDDIVNQKKCSESNRTSLLANWALNSLIMKPITFGWNWLSTKDDDGHSNDDKILSIHQDYRLINVETIQIISESIESYIKNIETTCMSYSKFINMVNKNVFDEKKLDEFSMNMVLIYLESQNKIKIYEDAGFKIIKFTNNIQTKDADITLAKLEMVKEILEKEASNMEKRMKTLNDEVHVSITNGNKEKALLLLKRKKRLENRVKEKDLQIDNIEILCSQLLETGSHQLMIKTFQMANDVLKKNSAKIEDVENVMSQMDDILNNQSMINEELNRPIQESTQLELEAELELEEILKEIDDVEKSGEKLTNANRSEQTSDLIEQLSQLSVINDDDKDSIKTKSSNKNPVVLLSE
ncbi:charged multivesicular body protein 7 [Dermatophagoides farinae]|uniref:Charged multivesicular body protein 7 n=1 Tax=Dermatophagoides farinae TaxID=6954 RepID=A0A922IDR2_DERFA|nr:charged multivesicular body protein 7-like [Dermatophagoides farinae]KAH7642132.1 charged multivesicular body protein-like protein [Dermatophagoides farinae]KAH9529280.1 Charged multivesicular body protein 7 [Dermatophagoides farinae]